MKKNPFLIALLTVVFFIAGGCTCSFVSFAAAVSAPKTKMPCHRTESGNQTDTDCCTRCNLEKIAIVKSGFDLSRFQQQVFDAFIPVETNTFSSSEFSTASVVPAAVSSGHFFLAGQPSLRAPPSLPLK